MPELTTREIRLRIYELISKLPVFQKGITSTMDCESK